MSATQINSHAAPAARAAGRRSDELEAAIARDPSRFRVLTGDRPTGPLHVGHLFGTLENRVRLQDLGVELFVLVADYQVLTDRDVADDLTGHVEELVLDYLAPFVEPTLVERFRFSREWMQGQFQRINNPHSGCFFLTAAQLARWAEQPDFAVPSARLFGPLESAATLGIMQYFRAYKPARENAAFLEIEHLDRRCLGKIFQPIPGQPSALRRG